MQLQEAIQHYCKYLNDARRADSTIAGYRGTLQRVASMMPTDFKVEDLRVGPLLEGLAQGNRADATWNRELSTLRGFSRWAFEAGHCSRHNLAGLPRSRHPRECRAGFQSWQLRVFFGTIRASKHSLSLRDETLFTLYAATGMRRSEALLLRWADFEEHGALLRIVQPKTRQGRWSYLPARLLRLLEEWRPTKVRLEQEFVFPGCGRAGSLTARQVNERFVYWKQEAGLGQSGLSLHGFRVGYATNLYRQSGDLAAVARALGHVDVRATLRYVGQRNAAIETHADAYLQRHCLGRAA